MKKDFDFFQQVCFINLNEISLISTSKLNENFEIQSGQIMTNVLSIKCDADILYI